MLDTLVLRFHDILGPHRRLAEWLDKPNQGTGKTDYLQPLDADRPNVTATVAFLKLTRYHDTGNVQRIAHYNHLNSAHYEIAYKIDDTRNFVEFNVSIPKYIFGTNILHYNTPPMGRDFSTSRHSRLKTNLRESYDRLFHFINKFITSELGSIEIDPRFVEINRVDICYNQMFDSKEDALEYLVQLKKLRKKNARNGSNYSRDWQTSIVYKTRRWSFKVYHKGDEFAKHDAKKLRERNETSGQALFDVPYYQDFADRILRYEMTIRNTHMSYLYMHNLFRADCHVWSAGVQLWKEQKAKADDMEAFQAFKAGLEHDEPHLIKYVNSIINRTKKFYLEDNTDSYRYDLETDQGRFVDWIGGRKETFNASSLFSRELWDLLSGEFLRVLGEFKLEIHANAADVVARAEALNAKIIDKRKVLLLLGYDKKSSQYAEAGETILISKIRTLMQMLETRTFEQIEESQIFSRTTWYRYRRQLKELGVTQTHQLSVAMLTKFDLKSYNSELLFNSYKFVNLSF